MPLLDVTDVILDPMFAQELTIKREFVQVGDNGRQTSTVTTVSPKPYGVVLPQNDAPMFRGPDQAHLPQLIQIHTQYRLRAIQQDRQPDIIVWHGADYVVNKVYPYSDYGAGFICADCSATALVSADRT